MNKSKGNHVARALSRVSTEPAELGCLIWEGAVSGSGYGQASLGGKRVYTHRLAWAFGLEGQRHGALPPPNVVIRHLCDTPRCCNPDHLQAGTQAENLRDMVERGRSARGDAHGSRKHPERVPRGDAHFSRKHPERMARGEAHGSRTHPERLARGEANGFAKLSDADVARVRELRAEGLKPREIAEMVGCSRPHVSKILRGLSRAPLAPKN